MLILALFLACTGSPSSSVPPADPPETESKPQPPPGMRALRIAINGGKESRFDPYLVRGAHIDVMHTSTEGGVGQTEIIAEKLLVLDVPEGPDIPPGAFVEVALSPEQAQVLVHAQNTGILTTMVRPEGE